MFVSAQQHYFRSHFINLLVLNLPYPFLPQAPVYCTTGHYEGSSVFSYNHSIYMYRDKVWAGRQVLRVFFLNPEALRSWGLTTEIILDWAAVWQQQEDEKIPIFQKCFAARKVDIRVGFSGTVIMLFG